MALQKWLMRFKYVNCLQIQQRDVSPNVHLRSRIGKLHRHEPRVGTSFEADRQRIGGVEVREVLLRGQWPSELSEPEDGGMIQCC